MVQLVLLVSWMVPLRDFALHLTREWSCNDRSYRETTSWTDLHLEKLGKC